MLKEDLLANPDDPRLLFYLAKTCDNLKYKKEAIEYYTKRILSTNPDDEVYESVIGLFSYKIKDNTLKEKDIADAISQFPDKPELTSLLTMFYYINGQYEKAYILAYKTIVNIEKLDPKNTIIYRKNLLLDNTIVFIDLHFLSNRIDEGIQILQKNLSIFPTNIRLHNIKHAICKPNFTPIKHEGIKTFVIHSGNLEHGFTQWDPDSLINNKSKASGSEIMSVNIANELAKIGYKCFIFGNFNFKCKTLNKVDYINADQFIQFAERNVIDWLVVSRSFDNLYYPATVKKVYLWVHDMLPYSSNDNLIFQTHKTKFKKVLCLSNWHKNLVSDELGIPLENIYVTRNSIDVKRYTTLQIEKIPFRFIYASAPDRGLTRLLKLFPSIKARFPIAELYIFCNDIDVEQKTLINTTDGVKYSPRVSQTQISIEFIKSDIWFYPTEFNETYCITALEAQIAGLLCVTTDCGSLGETVGNRGVIIPKNLNDNDMLKKLFFVLENPLIKERLVKKAKEWAILQDNESLVKDWIKMYNDY
jgi:glycosyltransferase involved in cell wall biosynthesis